MSAVYILLAFFAIVVAARVPVFYGLAKLLKAGTVTWGRVFGITALMLFLWIGAIAWIWSRRFPPAVRGADREQLAVILAGLLVFTVMCLAIKFILRGSFWRGLLTLLLTGIVVEFPAAAILKYSLVENFIVSTNSMAPTLRGWHRTAPCPKCGGTLVVRTEPPGSRQPPEKHPFAICERCLAVTNVNQPSDDLFPPDRFLIVKPLAPERWDLIVFEPPTSPPTQYVMRLVGLPGEEVAIRGGSVWINGSKQTLPALAGLRYVQDNEAQTWKLEDDEVFVLGDFPDISNDSRYWGPLLKENIAGVVTLRYRPFSRWLVLK